MWSQGQLGLTGLKAARIRSGDRWTEEKMEHIDLTEVWKRGLVRGGVEVLGGAVPLYMIKKDRISIRPEI